MIKTTVTKTRKVEPAFPPVPFLAIDKRDEQIMLVTKVNLDIGNVFAIALTDAGPQYHGAHLGREIKPLVSIVKVFEGTLLLQNS